MTLAAAGAPWGIDGPTFLGGYAILAVAVLAACLAVRWALSAGRDTGGASDLDTRPYDVAYLAGGPDRAVVAALSSLRLRGLIDARRGRITAAGSAGPAAHELDRAVLTATARPRRRSQVISQKPVRSALAETRERLESEGLLVGPGRRIAIRSTGLAMVAVLLVGAARFAAGVAGRYPVGYLALEMLVVLAAAAVLLMWVPRRTRSGSRRLASLRRSLHRYRPGNRPDWSLYGAHGAAMAVGLFGVAAVTASEPEMAEELALTSTYGGSGGGSSGGIWGGGGDGGGGDSGGGGGGCGGGGGGCGGGGGG